MDVNCLKRSVGSYKRSKTVGFKQKGFKQKYDHREIPVVCSKSFLLEGSPSWGSNVNFQRFSEYHTTQPGTHC